MTRRVTTSRRSFLKTGLAASAAVAAPGRLTAQSAPGATKTIRAVMHGDLTVLDPIWTTANMSAYHGAMLYDTLFGIDANLDTKPQMVSKWGASDDKKTWTFELRDGLKFSDGSAVTSDDVIASLRRWAARDGAGQHMMQRVADIAKKDDKTFQFVLKEPYGYLVDALGKTSTPLCYIMRKKEAETNPMEKITAYVGSGPFLFNEAETRQGVRYVYDRNPNYLPRSEPASGLAGGKVAKVDRVEWLSIPDQNTAISALGAGEIDYLQNPAMDTYPVLKADPKVRFVTVDPTGSMIWIRPNHLQPPFDNPKARQALLHTIDQTAILQAIGAPAENARPFCGSFFMCGTPLETKAGTAGLEKPDLEKARALLKESGYDGRPVVFMQPSDLAANFNATVVVAEGMRKAGFKVDIQPLDWGTLSQRRNNKGPVDANNKGGWNLFITVATALDASTPLTNPYLATPCPNDVAGFPCDEELQRLRRSWWESTDEAERAKLADQIQVRAYQVVPYVNGGQWKQYTAVRTTVSGLGETTVPVFWEVAKEG
jgi:peptide/nickel transport system substrate-binding protein